MPDTPQEDISHINFSEQADELIAAIDREIKLRNPEGMFYVLNRGLVRAAKAKQFANAIWNLYQALRELRFPYKRLGVLFSDLCGGDRGSEPIRLDSKDEIPQIKEKLSLQLGKGGYAISLYSDEFRARLLRAKDLAGPVC